MGDDAQLAQLSACLAQSLSPDQAMREQAETFLKSGSTQPGFSILLLKLLSSDAAEAQVRQSAAVTFKLSRQEPLGGQGTGRRRRPAPLLRLRR